jgi:hypothetical protein
MATEFRLTSTLMATRPWKVKFMGELRKCWTNGKHSIKVQQQPGNEKDNSLSRLEDWRAGHA